jgi:hypothetical protein
MEIHNENNVTHVQWLTPIISVIQKGGRDQEDHSLRPVQAKSETPSQPIKSWMWWHTTAISVTWRLKS